jgi:membrane protein DedA with SNARE-associated domain
MDSILHLISQYGYLIILFGVMAESTGVPLPGETILISAGILVQRGQLSLGDAILFGILGAVVGDQIGYWVGRQGGRPFVVRYGRYVLITPRRLERAEAFFARHGGKAVFMARFFSGLRVFGALVAGMSRMHWTTFVVYNALGGRCGPRRRYWWAISSEAAWAWSSAGRDEHPCCCSRSSSWRWSSTCHTGG